MIVYRLASPLWIDDLSGTGAKRYGGRWNTAGNSVLYTSQNISLCMLETLVQGRRERLKALFSVAKLKLPRDYSVFDLTEEGVPTSWNKHPHPLETQKIGDRWLARRQHLVMRVPSAANSLEHNFLINPTHSDFNRVELLETVDLAFNSRFA